MIRTILSPPPPSLRATTPRGASSLPAAAVLGLLMTVVGASGCGGPVQALGGGGSTVPKVTILLSDAAGGGDASASADAAPSGEKITGTGVVKGRVVVKGAVSALPPLLAQGAPTKDAVCATNAVPDESVIVGPDGGLANVYIFLKKAPNFEIPPPPAEPAQLDQKGCVFLPHAMIVRVGQPLKIINSDPVSHNARTAPLSGPAVNSILNANDMTGITVTYTKPENRPVGSKCDIHAWMASTHLVVNHPWAAVTGPDGSFEIAGAPATDLEFVVWHEKALDINRSLKVKLAPDQTAELEITVDASKLAGK